MTKELQTTKASRPAKKLLIKDLSEESGVKKQLLVTISLEHPENILE